MIQIQFMVIHISLHATVAFIPKAGDVRASVLKRHQALNPSIRLTDPPSISSHTSVTSDNSVNILYIVFVW